MLNKDQYNQDEYNDYYAQETRGAEISGGGGNEGSSKKIAIIFLLLLLILAVGYFGWKSMDSSTSGATTVDKTEIVSEVEKPVEEEEESKESSITPPASNQADEIAEQVQSIASSSKSSENMNPEDIANIVQMVMMKMNKEKSKESTTAPAAPSSTASSEDQAQDSQLMASLSGADVDSLSSISEGDDKKKPTLSKDVDIYNKVVLKEDKSASSDALSQLSDELSSVVESDDDSKPTNSSDYTASITKEVKTRQKEMRYYIVKKGDTLGKVAKKFYGNVMEYKKIYEANPDILRRPDKIYIGQKLRIP